MECAALLREQVRHVRERRARAQPRRLGRGGRRDAVRRPARRLLRRGGARGPSVPAGPGLLDDDGPRLDQPPQPLRGEAAGGAQFALLERAGLFEKAQRCALAGSEPRRRLRAAAQRPARRRGADHVYPVRDAQPALAPVALGCRGEAPGLEPQAGQFVQPALAGFRDRTPRLGELVLAHDLERARGRADERERVGERREVVHFDAARDDEQVRRDRGDVQDVAQRQDAALVRGDVAQLEDDADDGLSAERHGDERARRHTSGELRRDLVVEGPGEGAGADEREDGGVAARWPFVAPLDSATTLAVHSAPPSPRRRRLSP